MSTEENTSIVTDSVTAVIVNYNAGQALVDCVDSLHDQVCKVVIVDNDSNDKSLIQVDNNYSDDEKVLIIRNDDNLGFSAGCNIGLKQSQTENTLFINPDCMAQPGSIKSLISVLNSSQDIGMVGGFLMNSDGSEQAGGRRAVPTPWRTLVRVLGLYRFSNRWPDVFFDFHLHNQPLPRNPIEVEAISGACMLVKSAAVEDVGAWDEEYFLHCEDLDWSMRFRQKKWKIMFVPEAKFLHLLGICSKNKKIFVEWHKHKGMMRFYKKFFKNEYPGVLMLLVYLGVWMRFTLIVIHQSLKDVMGYVRLKQD
jgi:GT2 family glycosyltransferase